MTKANMQLPNGTKITIEGVPEEVFRTVQLIQGQSYSKLPQQNNKLGKKLSGTKGKSTGTMGRIRQLIIDDFFKTQKTLSDIKEELSTRGHIYAITTLSPAMIRLVRARELRRVKDGTAWTYVNN